MKAANPKPSAKKSHFIRLRLSGNTMADVDFMLATVPLLRDFSRGEFVLAAIRYALDSLGEDGYVRGRRAAPESHKRATRN